MTYLGQELVPVRAFSELRAGMTVVHVGCRGCGARHVMVLVRFIGWPFGGILHYGDDTPCHSDGGWIGVGSCLDEQPACWCDSIRMGLLFRLPDPAEEETDEREVTAPVRVLEDS